MTQTKALTKESINNLKLVVDQLPSSLRDTVIELDHEPCVSCIDVRVILAPGGSPSLKLTLPSSSSS